MTNLLLLINLINLINVINSQGNYYPDAKGCYEANKVCFGARLISTGGASDVWERSYGDNYGCFHFNKCDISLIGIRTEGSNPKWYLKTRWNPKQLGDVVTSRFTINENRTPFDKSSGYFEIESFRSVEGRIENMSRVVYGSKRDGTREPCESSQNSNSRDYEAVCFNYVSSYVNDHETVVVYESPSILRLKLMNGTFAAKTNIFDKNYIHVRLQKEGEKKADATPISTRYAFRLFNVKNDDNPPSMDMYSTYATLPTMRTTPLPKLITTRSPTPTGQTPIIPGLVQTPTSVGTPNIGETPTEVSSTPKKESKEKSEGFSSIYVIVIVVSVVVVVGIIIFVVVYVRRKKKKALGTTTEDEAKDAKLGSRRWSSISDAKSGNVSNAKSDAKSGNYKKKFSANNSNESLVPKSRLKPKEPFSKQTPKVGYTETAYIAPEDNFSTYFKK